MLRTGQLLGPAPHPASRPRTGASLPGTLASPRTGLTPAGCPQLVGWLRHHNMNLLVVMAPNLLDAPPVRRNHASGPVLTGSVETPPSETGDELTLEALQAAIRASWSLETCDPTDAAEWTPANPSRGQCAVTALVVHDLMGGELLEAEVHYHDGERQGFHYWNRLAGVDLDLTREQFTSQEVVQEPHVIDRLPEFPWRAQEQYLIFRRRVHAALQMQPPEGC